MQAWLQSRFDLISHEWQIDELRAVTRRRELRGLLRPADAGRVIDQLRAGAELLGRLPPVRRSSDPADDFLLALCEAGGADYLVTGDKAGLLVLRRHQRTVIVTARAFLDVIGY